VYKRQGINRRLALTKWIWVLNFLSSTKFSQ